MCSTVTTFGVNNPFPGVGSHHQDPTKRSPFWYKRFTPSFINTVAATADNDDDDDIGIVAMPDSPCN